MEIVTAAQMRAIEHATIESGAVTGLELMERAGRGVVEAIGTEWPELAAAPDKAIVLCGPGNNGGDGFVIARLLAEKGWRVEVYLLGDPAKLPADAAENYRRWLTMGEVAPLHPLPLEKLPFERVGLMIDALFGIGLKRPISDAVYSAWGRLLDEKDIDLVVSVDVPSGLDADSGYVVGDYVMRPHLTVTFHLPKPGHYLAIGPTYCHRLAVASIGISVEMQTKAVLAHHGLRNRYGFGDVAISLADAWGAANKEGGHKYSHGHALVLAGGVGKGGAARLAARGALRMGAGAVTLAAPPAAILENAHHLNAIMLARFEGTAGLGALLEDDRINVVVIGPGLGLGQRTRDMVRAAYEARETLSVVLDADALSSFADDPQALFDLTTDTDTVLTPHMGEFRTLFPDLHHRLTTVGQAGTRYSKVDAVREASQRAGCIVLLKGADTVIAAPTGSATIAAASYERSFPWLATAGAGDVLAGFIAGLLARGEAPIIATIAGAHLHQECAISFGPGLIAEDLPEELPKVLRALI